MSWVVQRVCRSAIASFVALTAFAGVAEASDLSLVDDPAAGGSFVSYVAAPGEANLLYSLGIQDGRLRLQDGFGAVAITSTLPCTTEQDPRFASCPAGDLVRLEFSLGDGADTGSSGMGGQFPLVMSGGDGPDTLYGGPRDDELYGDAGVDNIAGYGGSDWLDGGPGADQLWGDGFYGGSAAPPGIDVAAYDTRSDPVIASLDGVANDGVAGEGDLIGNDVEVIVGGSNDDALTGSPDPDGLVGSGGADTIDGQGGEDVLDGGAGNDTILARDGSKDAVDCGPGMDSATVDPSDTLVGCESVLLPPPSPPVVPPRAPSPWSAPGAVAGASGLPLFGLTPGGAGLGVFARAPSGSTRAVLTAAGTFAKAQPVVGIVPLQLALFGRDRVIVTGTSPGAKGSSVRALVAQGTVSGALGKPVALGALKASVPLALGANSSGDAAAVMRGSGKLQLLVRAAGGGSFGKPATLAQSSRLGAASVAVNTAADVLVAWEQNGVVYARVRRRSGSLGERQQLGAGTQAQLSSTLDATRRATVAWSSQRGSNGKAPSPAVIAYAYASPGKAFGKRRVIETVNVTGTGKYLTAPAVHAALLRDRGVLAWTGYHAGHFTVKAADIANGTLRPAQNLSPPSVDAVLGDVAVGPRGGVSVAWLAGITGRAPSTVADPVTGLPADQQRLYTSNRTPTAGAFSSPEAVSAIQRISTAPVLAIDPVSARLIALWQPVGQPITYATRTPIEPTATTAAARTNTSHWTRTSAGTALVRKLASIRKREPGRH